MPSEYKYRPIPVEKRRQPCPACGLTITRFSELPFHRDPSWVRKVARTLDYDYKFLMKLNPRTRIHRYHFDEGDFDIRGRPRNPPSIGITRIERWPTFKPNGKSIQVGMDAEEENEGGSSSETEIEPRITRNLAKKKRAASSSDATLSDASDDSGPPVRRKSQRLEQLNQSNSAPTPKPEVKKATNKKSKTTEEKKTKVAKEEAKTGSLAASIRLSASKESQPPVLSPQKPVEKFPVFPTTTASKTTTTVSSTARNSMFVVANSSPRTSAQLPRVEFGTGPPGSNGPTATVNGQPAQVIRNPDGSISLILPPLNPTPTSVGSTPVYNSMGAQIPAGNLRTAYHPSLPPPTTIIRAPAGVPLNANAIVSTAARAAAVVSSSAADTATAATAEETEANSTAELLQRLIESAMENNVEAEKTAEKEVVETPKSIRVKAEPLDPEAGESINDNSLQHKEVDSSRESSIRSRESSIRPLLGRVDSRTLSAVVVDRGPHGRNSFGKLISTVQYPRSVNEGLSSSANPNPPVTNGTPRSVFPNIPRVQVVHLTAHS